MAYGTSFGNRYTSTQKVCKTIAQNLRNLPQKASSLDCSQLSAAFGQCWVSGYINMRQTGEAGVGGVRGFGWWLSEELGSSGEVGEPRQLATSNCTKGSFKLLANLSRMCIYI